MTLGAAALFLICYSKLSVSETWQYIIVTPKFKPKLTFD